MLLSHVSVVYVLLRSLNRALYLDRRRRPHHLRINSFFRTRLPGPTYRWNRKYWCHMSLMSTSGVLCSTCRVGHRYQQKSRTQFHYCFKKSSKCSYHHYPHRLLPYCFALMQTRYCHQSHRKTMIERCPPRRIHACERAFVYVAASTRHTRGNNHHAIGRNIVQSSYAFTDGTWTPLSTIMLCFTASDIERVWQIGHKDARTFFGLSNGVSSSPTFSPPFSSRLSSTNTTAHRGGHIDFVAISPTCEIT